MPDKQGLVKRAMMKIGSLAVKYAGGISFDAVSAGWYLRNGFPNIYSILTGGMPAWSGEAVSVETALNHSVVWACNKIISESIGFLPALVLQEKNGAKRLATEHPMYIAMHDMPNEEVTAQAFMEALTSHVLLQGNGYAQIIRRSSTGTAVQLNGLLPQNVFPDREKGGSRRLVYVVKEPGVPDKTYTVEPGKPHDILHIRGLGWDGLRGFSVITMGRQSIGSAIAAERNTARFWAYGGRRPYILNLDKKFQNDEEFNKFRDDWEKVYSEPQRAPILEPWVKLQEIGTTMREAQFIETRMFIVSEICRWFNVSPHLVHDLTHATFSNVEHLALDFVKFSLSPWIWRWRQEFKRCVLTAEERAAGYYLNFDDKDLLRGDFLTRMQAYSMGLQNAVFSPDEVRAFEEMDPLPDGAGECYHIQLNMQTVGGDKPQKQGPDSQTPKPPAGDEDEKRAWWLRRIA